MCLVRGIWSYITARFSDSGELLGVADWGLGNDSRLVLSKNRVSVLRRGRVAVEVTTGRFHLDTILRLLSDSAL